MSDHSPNPPYFQQLLARLEAGDSPTIAAFGRHVHWGYWDEPPSEDISPEQYGQAAEQLCLAVLENANLADGQHVLDIGCGFGGTIACINDKYSHMNLLGVNIDARQLERASELVKANNGNKVKFIEGDAAQLPCPASNFDVVLAVECAFHFDRQLFLAEVGRVLRPGGCLAISDFIPDERAVEYIRALDLSSNEAVRWMYGKIDLEWPIARYQEVAASYGLTLTLRHDITSQTLPTYSFLEASVKNWMGAEELKKFRYATSLLEKASRKGLIGYQILKFEKA